LRFTLRHLEYFVAVGETGSVTQAAQRVNISQPSISAAISHLETEFGVQLFIRHHAQGLSLTPAGQTLLRETKLLLQQVDSLHATASGLADQVVGPIDVGCLLTLAPLIMPELCHSFSERYPRTQIRVVEEHQEALFDKLRAADISLALTYDLDIPEDVSFEPLASLPPYAVFAAAHPFAGRASVSLDELASEPLVLLDLPMSRTYFLALFRVRGLEPVTRTRVHSPEVMRGLVARGYGYGIANVRPRNKASLDGHRLAYVPLSGDHRPMRLGLATLHAWRKTKLVAVLEAHCRALITNGSVPGMTALL
jgi:DNA-binding transcriptional LysR family regulator